MIWRRLLVHSVSSIADLHHFIQIAMGWEDTHLHRFTFMLKSMASIAWVAFGLTRMPISSSCITLAMRSFAMTTISGMIGSTRSELKPFCLSKIRRLIRLALQANGQIHLKIVEVYEAYLERQQDAPFQTIELFSQKLADQTAWSEDEQGMLRDLLPWLKLEHFDRRAVNRRLRLYAEGDEEWMFVNWFRALTQSRNAECLK